MIQTPINVVPSNGEVLDASKRAAFSFTFQGDLLTFVQGIIADMEYTGDPNSGTNEYVAYYNMPSGGHLSTIYNGGYCSYYDSEDRWMARFFKDGRNYKHMLRLYQHYPAGINPELERKPMADMYYARGKIYKQPEGTALHAYQAVIAPNLTNIHEPYRYKWTDSEGTEHVILLGGIYIDIEHERHLICGYDPATGIVSFRKPTFKKVALDEDYTALEIEDYDINNWTVDYVGAKFHVAETPYKLFTNYLETGWYDFKYRTPPVVTTEIITSVNKDTGNDRAIKGVNVGIYCDGTYAQATGVGLKWYKYELYAVNASSFSVDTSYSHGDLAVYNNQLYKYTYSSATKGAWNDDKWELCNPKYYGSLIDQTEKIYSYELNTSFPTQPCDYGYAVVLTVCTQDDNMSTTDYVVGKYANEAPNIWGLKINNVEYEFDNPDTNVVSYMPRIIIVWSGNRQLSYSVFRRDVRKNGSMAAQAVYLTTIDGDTTTTGTKTYVFVDYSVGNHQNYRYEIVVKNADDATYGQPLGVHYIYNVFTDWDGWSIMGLTPQKSDYNRNIMKVGSQWRFISEINSGDITQNINSALHVGTAAYAKSTRDFTKYESGTFTANLLDIQCPDNQIVDDIERVKAWKAFISQNSPFLLKSAKGDVWVVTIVNNPSRRYDETLDPIFTNITYEWAECQEVDKCVFV